MRFGNQGILLVTLKEMTDTSRLKDDEPMPAVAAVHALYELGMEDDYAVQFAYPKLEGRPALRVKAFLANLEGQPQEKWLHYISEFAKHVNRV